MMLAKLWAPALTACALATSIALVGCSKDPKEAEKAAAAQKMPPTEVGVVVAQPQSVEQSVELSGRTSAYEISEVRPQTNGVILRRLFVEGSYVNAGQPLYIFTIFSLFYYQFFRTISKSSMIIYNPVIICSYRSPVINFCSVRLGKP